MYNPLLLHLLMLCKFVHIDIAYGVLRSFSASHPLLGLLIRGGGIESTTIVERAIRSDNARITYDFKTSVI